ncbi:hypothetical protein EDB92DRAFT_1868452 [Lactarius akahatsu]|uniref:Uncharacterized protein n=1 Tax=Lactarius akahatsu TaxID=416441 RepID=A0AAD4LDH6_9AGAM|nr:hypothetical protein EDB92DRAFT_1868452 [Lactarius akahatsu]
MDPSIAARAPSTQDVPMIKTEERPRPIPAQGHHPPQRVQRYKDKFQTLRERYDTVTSMHTEYTRAVQRATEKELRLQAEINMLLDSALAASPPPQLHSAPPTSAQTATPTPTYAQLSPATTTTQLVPPAPFAAHTNGHSRSYNNHPPPDREHHGGAAEYATNYHRSSSSSSSSYYPSPTGPHPPQPPLIAHASASATATNVPSGDTPALPPSPPHTSVHSRW